MNAFDIVDSVSRETGELLAEQTDAFVAIGDERAYVLVPRDE